MIFTIYDCNAHVELQTNIPGEEMTGDVVNDALLCAMEWLLGRPLIRPEISGLMGAFGAALLARDEVRLANTKGADLPAYNGN